METIVKKLFAIIAVLSIGGLAACTENPVAQDEVILNGKEVRKDKIMSSPILPPQKIDTKIREEDYDFKANMK